MKKLMIGSIKSDIEIFVPSGDKELEALKRTTHLAIGAHSDDIEIFAYHGIQECFKSEEFHFTSITMTDGAGSPRKDLYKEYSDQLIIETRKNEQKKAAYLGDYSAAIFLGYSSGQIKDPNYEQPVTTISELIHLCRPMYIYTHNIFDKHNTHVAVCLRVISALKQISQTYKPIALYGCETWRDLDWLTDEDKIVFDVSKHPNLSQALIAVHDSQIVGSKRYDLGILGRRKSHAVMNDTHDVEKIDQALFAVDMTPLIGELSPQEYVKEHINDFLDDVLIGIQRVS